MKINHNIQTIRFPTKLPVSVVDLKNWINRDPLITHEDWKYSAAIRAALQAFENVTMRRIVLQRVVWRPTRFGDQDLTKYQGHTMPIPLGKTDTDSVIVTYVDSDGVTTPFTDFTVVTANEKSNSEIVLDSGAEWPTDIDCEKVNPIEISFDCGWPTGNEWKANTAYTDEIIIPTFLNQTGAAYEVSTAGTSGATEPTWDTETGSTQAEGPDTLVWECIGGTVPDDIKAAILCGAAEKCVTSGLVQRVDPNLNFQPHNWEKIVEDWRLWK